MPHSPLLLFFFLSTTTSLPTTLPLRRLPTPTARPSHSLLFPHSYGGHSFLLDVGSPPQSQHLVLDTAARLTWLPCTPSYACRLCSNATTITPFLPTSSTTLQPFKCPNPKPHHNSCPKYTITTGSAFTSGHLITDTVSLPDRSANAFVLGCSLASAHQPSAGVAAFGSAGPTFQHQLRLQRFSYCFISHGYDDIPVESGSLYLDDDDDLNGVQFTPFLNKPTGSAYYYVGLQKIAVNGKAVKLPASELVLNAFGNGGVIIDSATSLTVMKPALFEPVAAAVVAAVTTRYNRSAAVEERTKLSPCFAVPSSEKNIWMPDINFYFDGGAVLKPRSNFVFADDKFESYCLVMVSGAGDGGPAVRLGNYLQQDFYVVFDLERNRFGFRDQTCMNP